MFINIKKKNSVVIIIIVKYVHNNLSFISITLKNNNSIDTDEMQSIR